jgi:hypothetical protein
MARTSNLAKGKTRTKKIKRGPNKGDTVQFRGSPSGKPYPVRVLRDVGSSSTLRNNSGVKFGKAKKKRVK